MQPLYRTGISSDLRNKAQLYQNHKGKNMNKEMYSRLTLLLAIPLLIAGWFTAENEIFIKTHTITYCNETICHSDIVSQTEREQLNQQRQGEFINLGLMATASIPNFTGNISIKDDTKTEIIANTDFKRIINRQTLTRDFNGTKWYIQHNDGRIFELSPLKQSDAQLLNNLFNRAENETEKIKQKTYIAYYISMLIPTITYFILSILFFILIRYKNFVQKGSFQKNDSQG